MMATDAVRAVGAGRAGGRRRRSGRPAPCVLVPIAVVLGAGEGLFMPGSFAIIPRCCPAMTCRPATRWRPAGRSWRRWSARRSAARSSRWPARRRRSGRRGLVRRLGADAGRAARGPRPGAPPADERRGAGRGRRRGAARRRCGRVLQHASACCRSCCWSPSRPTSGSAGWTRSRCPRWRTARCTPAPRLRRDPRRLRRGALLGTLVAGPGRRGRGGPPSSARWRSWPRPRAIAVAPFLGRSRSSAAHAFGAC